MLCSNMLIFSIIFVVLGISSRCTDGWPADIQIWVHEDKWCTGSSSMGTVKHCWVNPMFGATSAKIFKGGCVKFHRQKECLGDTFLLAYPRTEICAPGTPFEAMSLSMCDSWTVRTKCPDGQYVRQVGYGRSDLTNGLTLYCYKPNNPNQTIFDSAHTTHGGNLTHLPTSNCPIVSWGIVFNRDNINEIDLAGRVVCNRNNELSSGEIAASCTGISALAGLEVLFDEVNTIKQSKPICVDVPDPSELCDPVEDMRFVYLCDNSNSGNEMECSYSSTIGVGFSNTSTVGDRHEYSFYSEYGYTIGGTLSKLSASMSYKLGKSELVSYEWSQSDTSTWTLQTTIMVKTNLRPYSATRVEQLSGKCSFYGVDVNYFRQTDVNATHTVVTTFSI